MANTIQLPEEDLCFSCFRPLQGRTICAHCGFDPGQAQEDDWNRMPPGTRLHDRYLVGRVLGQGGFGITYLGYFAGSWFTSLGLDNDQVLLPVVAVIILLSILPPMP